MVTFLRKLWLGTYNFWIPPDNGNFKNSDKIFILMIMYIQARENVVKLGPDQIIFYVTKSATPIKFTWFWPKTRYRPVGTSIYVLAALYMQIFRCPNLSQLVILEVETSNLFKLALNLDCPIWTHLLWILRLFFWEQLFHIWINHRGWPVRFRAGLSLIRVL